MAEKDGNEVAATYKLSKIKLNNQVYDIGADWSNISNAPAFINPMTRAEVTEIVEGLYPNATSSEITEMVDDLLENYTDVNENLIETILETGSSTPIQYAPINSPALTGTPTAPTAAAGTDTTQIATTAFVQQEKFSGNYNDLTNKPTIPEAQVNSDWTATLGMAQILNKPSITSGTGTNSIIEGSFTYNIASGQYSHAEGSHTTASGSDAHAEGEYATASNNASHAEGRNTIASGIYGHAEGCYTTAAGSNSHAEGLNTVAAKANQHVFGTYNIYEGGNASEKGVYVEVVGNGGTENTRSNARTLDWNGNEILSGKLTVGTAPTNDMDVTTKAYVDTKLNLKAPSASPSLTGTPTAPTAQTGTNTTQIATTAFVKNAIDSLGLAGAMRFKGTATVEITDGSTTNPIISGYDWNEKQLGDVVLYDGKEFVWTGLLWEMLGPDTSFKIQQSVVADPSASGTATAFISSISQDTNGNITATKANLPTSIFAKDITISTYGDTATASLRITEGPTVPLNIRLTTKPTQSAIGLVEMLLGSSTSAGYKNVQGKLSIYDATGYSSIFYHSNNLTANRTYSLPDATGTLALLESPTFSGTPTAPTAAAGTSTTQIATTAFVNNNYYPKSGGSLNTNASITLNKYNARFVTIDGNGIAADMSAVDTYWAGAFAKVKDAANDETVMLGWYGNSTALGYIYMGGTYTDPAMKMTKDGNFTFKNAVTGTSGFIGNLTGNASTATKTYVNNNSNEYYLIGANNTTAENKDLKISNLLKATISNDNYDDITLTLGNAEYNKNQGYLKIYDADSYTGTIKTADALTNDRIYEFLDSSGYIPLFSKPAGSTFTGLGITSRNGTTYYKPLYLNSDGQLSVISGSLDNDILGNAATATKATQDANGNTITTTYAPLASPSLTGTPTAPTAAANTNTTQIATTAFVKAAIDAALGGIENGSY